MDAAINVIVEEITQHAKCYDDKKAIITEEPKSHLKGLLLKEDKKKEEDDFRLELKLQLRTEDEGLRTTKRKERDLELKEKSY